MMSRRGKNGEEAKARQDPDRSVLFTLQGFTHFTWFRFCAVPRPMGMTCADSAKIAAEVQRVLSEAVKDRSPVPLPRLAVVTALQQKEWLSAMQLADLAVTDLGTSEGLSGSACAFPYPQAHRNCIMGTKLNLQRVYGLQVASERSEAHASGRYAADLRRMTRAER